MKKLIVLIISMSILLGVALNVSAIKGDYGGTTSLFSDIESSGVVKKTYSTTAWNDVSYIEKGRLYSWVELGSGLNITSQVEYGSTGRKSMTFYSTNHVDKTTYLNVSQALTNFSSISTSGNWTPN